MPYNLLKRYNEFLEIASFTMQERKESLIAIFNRDIVKNNNFKFRNKFIYPTPADGLIKIEILFTHLTTTIIDYETNKREFEIQRSIRLHWLKYHIDENKTNNMLIFTVKEKEGFRTYIYDKDENYVIVLEPLRNGLAYYLLTAYYIMGKDAKREKIMSKYKRKWHELL